MTPHSAEPVLGLAEGKTRGLHAGYLLSPLEIGSDRAHNPPMTQVSCQCGATYEVIETKGPSRDDDVSVRCAVCGKDLFCWSGSDVGQLRLVSRPEQDRE